MKKTVKLGQKQLRAIIAEELKRVSEASKFKATDVPLLVEQDAELFEATSELIGQLASFVEKLAKKEGLVPEDDYEFIDLAMQEADNVIREAVYNFIENALETAHTVGGE